MFFHTDEAGNTGNNLFDIKQPKLSYGVLSSVRNVDVLCVNVHKKILNLIDSNQIHASELGIEGLIKIAPLLLDVQNKMKFDFDYYFIVKKDYALVSFFDSVFDAGLNPAVRWDTYWTPLRYLIITRLSTIFDVELLKDSWLLCSKRRVEDRENKIIKLLIEVKCRTVKSDLDPRTVEIIVDALEFGISNPLELDFSVNDQNIISPNAIGFQFVVSSIARRVRNKKKKTVKSIIVDLQQQFNDSQILTHDYLKKLSDGLQKSNKIERDMYLNQPLYSTMNKSDILNTGFPNCELTISKSIDSIGLQIVDVYLWLANKVFSGAKLPQELHELWSSFSSRIVFDGISLEGMGKRYMQFDKKLPDFKKLTKTQIDLSKKVSEQHMKKVKELKNKYHE